MIELDKKYVFHIPLYKYSDGKLIAIEMEGMMDDLIDELGFESLYMTKVKSLYKKRMYDEILVTVFTSDEAPEVIFENWFRNNNGVLCQEAFAYELDGKMVVKKLK